MPISLSRGSLAAVSLLTFTLLGAGCGSRPPLIEPNTGNVNLQGANGSALSAGENLQIPANFPNYFPQYPNAKTTLVFTENEGKSGTLVQQTNTPYAEAQTWVEQSMQAQGFTKENAMTAPNLVLLTFVKGQTRCQVNVAQQDTLTQIQTTCVEQ